MIDVNKILIQEFSLKDWQVENALALKAEGATIPFIARYRKERTGEMDENVLRDMFDRFEYILELEDRKKTILNSIEEQGKLTDELRAKIENCMQKNELEDLYLPYKPKKRTRATIAREKGLEPLADIIRTYNMPNAGEIDLTAEATKFVNAEKEVNSATEALKGAADIIAEGVSEIAEIRAWVREFIAQKGSFSSSIKADFPEGTTKFEMYRNFEMSTKEIKPHIMLALRRGEAEEIVSLDLKFEEEIVLNYIEGKTVFTSRDNLLNFYKAVVKDAFNRLMKISLIGEVRLAKKVQADEESIRVFEANMRQLLLSSPAGMKPTLGIDPGFRTGCKVAVVDNTGKFIQYKNIHPFKSFGEKEDAKRSIKELIASHNIELVAIGNGTASRETDEFMDEVYKEMELKPVKVLVNESGASIYSASKVANEEFPELDLTVRGAISIARRLQDPLAELVKIDPKSIGVGQYQHDVDQKLLKKKLEETVVSCVNYVGVDLNTASKELLTRVSGINDQVAKSIVEWRNANGAFKNRKQLLKVPRFGDKKFEQAAGFLRIRDGENSLDNTAVHPESYYLVEKMAQSLEVKVNEMTKIPEQLKALNLTQFVDDKVGLPTLKDIIAELQKPGRDPRAEFRYAVFEGAVKEIKDLRIGMELEGVVTNITNFGAFVDIGVHQDGLVHISEMADRFISTPTDVVKVGEVVKVKVIEVNEPLKRINLSMKKNPGATKPSAKAKKDNPSPQASLNDLMSKFGK